MKAKKSKSAKASPVIDDTELSYINPKLHVLAVPIDSLKPKPDNARTHDERNLEATRQSLERCGQQKPIVIDSDRVVRAGNGTLLCAQALGWTHIAAVESNLSGAALDAYEIADNRTAELAGWDPAELARQLDALDAAGIEKELLGFSSDEYEELLKLIPTDDDEEPDTGSGSPGPSSPPADQYKIVIDCRDEMHQTELLDRFDQEGLKCKALVS